MRLQSVLWPDTNSGHIHMVDFSSLASGRSCAVQVPNDLDQRSQVQVSQLHFLPATNLHLICLERTMSELKPLLLGSMFALLVVSAVPAQVTIDVSKITCDQYVLDQVTDFRTITAWLDGFYSGRRNNTVVDVQALGRIADKVEEYCRSHRDMPLMQAVETTLGVGDRAVGSKK